MSVDMKWVIIDEDETPLYWCEGDDCVGHIMEFDTEEDARIFLEASDEIPFVDVSWCHPVSIEHNMEGSRNYTGFIPVQNGDSIDLVRR